MDYPYEMALLATIPDKNGEREIGVARYARYPGTDRGEVAVVVADDWQHKGIASSLLLGLRNVAEQAGIKCLEVTVLRDNTRMINLARKLGFRISPKQDDFLTIELGKYIGEK